MGKKRIKIIGTDESSKDKKKRKLVKTGKEHGRITDMSAEALVEAEQIKKKEKELAKLEKEAAQKEIREKTTKKKEPKKRGKKYLKARNKINPQKTYSLGKAIKLLKEAPLSKFDGSVEVHLNLTESGLKGEASFPHSTGKSHRVKIADEKLINKLDKGKIDFDVLIAAPAMMPKLVKYAKLLGPKGLMPNPKAGTITEKPAELAKKMAGKSQFRSETKAPLLHQVIGKVTAKESHLVENFRVLVEAIGPSKIQKAVLSSTMGPGIKVDLESI